MTDIELTRENVIDLAHQARALERKAQCRAIYGEFIDALDEICEKLEQLDYELTERIGD